MLRAFDNVEVTTVTKADRPLPSVASFLPNGVVKKKQI